MPLKEAVGKASIFELSLQYEGKYIIYEEYVFVLCLVDSTPTIMIIRNM